LRFPALGDVQLREHLQARRDTGHHPLGDPLHLVQDAVDAKPNGQGILLRLEVDVRGSVLGRLEDDRVDEPNEGRLRDPVLGLEIVDVFFFLLEQRLLFGQRSPRAEGLGRTREAAKLGEDVLAGGNSQLELVTAREP